MPIRRDIEQGSAEWRAIRCGLVTASRMSDVLAQISRGEAAGRRNYRAELVVERMTGIPTEHYTNADMQWGTDQEPNARATYELVANVDVERVGFAVHPELAFSGASPDGLVDDEGLVEFKCPRTATHIETLRTRKIPGDYFAQIQWTLACTERVWCDFCSYDPRMRDTRLVLFRQRVYRDDVWIKATTEEVIAFNASVDAEVAELVRIAEAVA